MGKSHPIHLSARKAREYGLWFDEAAAERACSFFERYLRHGKGKWAGRPFGLMPWQRDEVIRPLFGWKRADGTRRFRQGGIWVPKKNGKTPLGAGILLYMLLADGEIGAECYSAATTRDQAAIIFRDAARMVRLSPRLSRRLKVTESTKTIGYPASFGLMKALSGDSASAEGYNTSALCYDELHAAPNRKLWDAVIYGGAAREQPLFISTSTAGEYDPTSIGWEQWEYARNVLSGTWEDPYFFAYIAAAEASDDWKDPRVWRKANPSLGVTIKEEDLAAEVKAALNSPSKAASLQRYRLNIWVQQIKAWMNMEAWKECGMRNAECGIKKKHGRDRQAERERLFTGMPCWGGLDLSRKVDLTACAWIFQGEDGRYHLVVRMWMPEEKLAERAREGAQPWGLWVEQGWIRVTAGAVVDYGVLAEDVLADARRFRPAQVGFDPWNSASVVQALSDEGVEMIEVTQNMANLSRPTKELERLALGGLLDHGNNPVLNWMVGNVAVHADTNENIKPDRRASRGHIDGVLATLMALGRAIGGESNVVAYSNPYGD